MKALSVKQPWAGLIAGRVKTIELRTRRTNYRGELLICSSAEPASSGDAAAARVVYGMGIGDDLRGVALCVVNLVDCRPAQCESPEDTRAACCRPESNSWAWVLEFVRRVEPQPVKGVLGFFEVDIDPARSQASIEAPSSSTTFTIDIKPEAAGWRWTAELLRMTPDEVILTGWAYGTRYNAECAARNRIAYEVDSRAADAARVVS